MYPWGRLALAFAPATSARRLEVQYVSFRQTMTALSGQLRHLLAAALGEPRASRRACVSALQAVRPQLSALRQQGHLRIGEQLYLSNQSIAATEPTRPTRSVTVRVTANPEWIGVLQRLDGRV